jgi:hypothetical protein
MITPTVGASCASDAGLARKVGRIAGMRDGRIASDGLNDPSPPS